MLFRSTSADNATGLKRLSDRVSGVSDDTNFLLQQLAESGVEIPDSPYIQFALEAAEDISHKLAQALERGDLSEADMFSDRYSPVPGTNPVLYTHPVQSFITAAARPHQEKARVLKGLWGMTCTDRNTWGGVAMPERSQQQRPGDDAWNAEHARAGMMFDYPDQRQQCAITQPFCLKAYRRPMASGEIILLKQVIASISVQGRHWGILQLAYADQS